MSFLIIADSAHVLKTRIEKRLILELSTCAVLTKDMSSSGFLDGMWHEKENKSFSGNEGLRREGHEIVVEVALSRG